MRLLKNVESLFLTAPDDKRVASRNAMMLRRHVTEANDMENIKCVLIFRFLKTKQHTETHVSLKFLIVQFNFRCALIKTLCMPTFIPSLIHHQKNFDGAR